MIGGMANNTNIGTSIVTGQIWLVFITGNHNLTLVRHHYPVIVKVVLCFLITWHIYCDSNLISKG